MTTPTALTPTSHCVSDDTFWPPINLIQLRDALSSTSKVNKALAAWRYNLRQQGYTYLEEVPAPSVNDCSILVSHYISAVETTAALELYQHLKVAECGRACPLDEAHANGLFTREYRHHDE